MLLYFFCGAQGFIAKVNNLIQNLIDKNQMVFKKLLIYFSKIILQNAQKIIEMIHTRCRSYLKLRADHKEKILSLNIHKLDLIDAQAIADTLLFFIVTEEDFMSISWQFLSIVFLNEQIAVHCEDAELAYH